MPRYFLLPISPALIFGWGPIPSFGVGVLASIGTVQLNLTVAIVTAAVGNFGSDAVAGYGVASRLGYMQVPLLFGLGTAIITMVGVNVGAGQMERAQKITWIGALIAFIFATLIGFFVAFFSIFWLIIFIKNQQVITTGTSYLQKIAPFYGFIAAGMPLYFTVIGMKQVLWPVLAGTARMVIAACIGWIAVTYCGAGLSTLYNILVVSILIYCLIIVVAMTFIVRSNRLHMLTLIK